MQWTSRRATVLGMGAAAVLAVGFLSAPASNAQTSIDDACAELIGAGDNFAEACDAELASMDDSDAPLGVDEIASTPNLKQIANLPKQAPFDTASAYNTDIAFQGNYAFAGNYDGFTIYDIKKPSPPKIADPGVLRRVRRTTSRSTATCSSSPPTPPAATTPARASRSPRRSRSRGRA